MEKYYYLTPTIKSILDYGLSKLQLNPYNSSNLFSLEIWEQTMKYAQIELVKSITQYSFSNDRPFQSDILNQNYIFYNKSFQRDLLNQFIPTITSSFLKEEILTDIYYCYKSALSSTTEYIPIRSTLINQRLSMDTSQRQSIEDIDRAIRRKMHNFHSIFLDMNLSLLNHTFKLYTINPFTQYEPEYTICIHPIIAPYYFLLFDEYKSRNKEFSKMDVFLKECQTLITADNPFKIPFSYYLERFLCYNNLYKCSEKLYNLKENNTIIESLYPTLCSLLHPCIAYPYVSQRIAAIENFFLSFSTLISLCQDRKTQYPNEKNILNHFVESSYIFQNIYIHKILAKLQSNRWLLFVITEIYNELLLASYLYLFINIPISLKEKLNALEKYLLHSKTFAYKLTFPNTTQEMQKSTLTSLQKILITFSGFPYESNIYTNYMGFLNNNTFKNPFNFEDSTIGSTNCSAVKSNTSFATYDNNMLYYNINIANNYINTEQKHFNTLYEHLPLF